MDWEMKAVNGLDLEANGRIEEVKWKFLVRLEFIVDI